MSSRGEIVIIGAGLVGSLLAYILTKKGFEVSVFERYGDIRQIPSLGRSINLVITSRGLRACDAIGGGLREELLGLAVPVTGRVLHQMDGSVQFQRYGKDDSECNYSISRYELNKFLIQKAEESGARLFFGHALDVDGTNFGSSSANGEGGDVGSVLAFEVMAGGGAKEKKFVRCSCPVLGCDGGGSRVRYAMRNQGLTEFSESLLGAETGHTHGYKEMLFPKGSGLVSHGLHIWPRNTHMLMALANLDGSMTGTLYMDSDGGSESFDELKTPESAKVFFEKYYSEAIPMIGGVERAIEQMISNPNGLLGTVRTSKWHALGRVVLLGDAAHAIVPFFGQGMNSGFEDVYELTKIMERSSCCGGKLGPLHDTLEACLAGQTQMDSADASKWAAAFAEYSDARFTNGNAIADMAIENFEEMRDSVSDRSFLLLKRVENRIENHFGAKFRSRYAMVCYGGDGNVSYRNAFILGKIQHEILRELIVDQAAQLEAIPDDSWGNHIQSLADSVCMEKAERLIDERLVPMQTQLGVDLATVSH